VSDPGLVPEQKDPKMTALSLNLVTPNMTAEQARLALHGRLDEAERRAADWVARLGRPGYMR
jgi:hypothetical protein